MQPGHLRDAEWQHLMHRPSDIPGLAYELVPDMEGRRRGVTGSPHFFVGEDDFFCPALDLGHDEHGNLTARFDTAGLAEFFRRIDD